MPIHTFSCECGWSGDRRVGWSDSLSCPSCGSQTKKAEVYPIAFSGFAETPRDQITYWREFREFKEASAELEYKHKRMEEAAGKELPTPPLARYAVAEAKKLALKGVKSSKDYAARLKH